jgi:hypothetical protein
MLEGLIVRPGARRSFISDVRQFTIAKKICWKEKWPPAKAPATGIEQIGSNYFSLNVLAIESV